jgi:hypothetical protein
MSEKDYNLKVRLDAVDRQYLTRLVTTTDTTPSDVLRVLIRNVPPEDCQRYLDKDGSR